MNPNFFEANNISKICNESFNNNNNLLNEFHNHKLIYLEQEINNNQIIQNENFYYISVLEPNKNEITDINVNSHINNRNFNRTFEDIIKKKLLYESNEKIIDEEMTKILPLLGKGNLILLMKKLYKISQEESIFVVKYNSTLIFYKIIIELKKRVKNEIKEFNNNK